MRESLALPLEDAPRNPPQECGGRGSTGPSTPCMKAGCEHRGMLFNACASKLGEVVSPEGVGSPWASCLGGSE